MLPIELIRKAAVRPPAAIAAEGPGFALTYHELFARIDALAAALQQIDPEPQSRVGICAYNTLVRHPAVYECVVFGMPDEKWGEAVTAAVQLNPGAAASADDIIAFAKSRSARSRRPSAWCSTPTCRAPRSARCSAAWSRRGKSVAVRP